MYTSIRTHSHFSLLASSAKAERIAQTCVKLGQKSCVLTDYNNLSGAISFGRELGKVGVKPIYGVRILTPTMRYVSLIAKNLQGWKQLISLVSYANEQKNIISYKPTLTVDEIIEAMKPGNLILTFGGIDSSQENDSVARLLSSVSHENIFLEIESPADKMTSHLRSLPLRRVAAKPVFYATRKDAIEHRVLLASNEKSTIEKINRERMRGTSTWMDRFFAEDIYNLSSINELKELGFLDDEISNTQIIDEMCESYKITNRPSLPKFDCPNGMDEDAYIRQLCRDGWKQKRLKSWDEKTYVDRINKELGVISEASLPGYFLIVRDFIQYAKDNGWLIGAARGSGAGSLVAYLLGITCIDPIPFDLIFERFYNAGRNTKDKVSYPDIDVDVPVHKRQLIIDYIRGKYGADRVCHIATFGSLQGKGAIKEVLRVHNVCEAKEIDHITAQIPPEFQIMDALEESGEESVLRWTLENEPSNLSDWVFLNDDGTLGGQYAEYFEQAINLEGVYKSRGKHPSGIIISPSSLDAICPMMWDIKSEEKIAGMNMGDLEELGLVKFDVLGLLALDKLMGVRNLLLRGKIE